MRKLKRWLALGVSLVMLATATPVYAKNPDAAEEDVNADGVFADGDEVSDLTEYVPTAIELHEGYNDLTAYPVRTLTRSGAVWIGDDETGHVEDVTEYEYGYLCKIIVPSGKTAEMIFTGGDMINCYSLMDGHLDSFFADWREDSNPVWAFNLSNGASVASEKYIWLSYDSTNVPTSINVTVREMSPSVYSNVAGEFKPGKNSFDKTKVSDYSVKSTIYSNEEMDIPEENAFVYLEQKAVCYTTTVPAHTTYCLIPTEYSVDYDNTAGGFSIYDSNYTRLTWGEVWNGSVNFATIVNDTDQAAQYYVIQETAYEDAWISEVNVFPMEENSDPQPEALDVVYRTHVQGIGWQDYVSNGEMAGTKGQSKRLEGINISMNTWNGLGIQYTTHCQSYGWLPWVSNGQMSGTSGESKRLEAIMIRLTGENKDKYDVYYRVHAQSYGWLSWAKNGEPAGTAGKSKRLEAIQIVVVSKDTQAPGATYKGITSDVDRAYVSDDAVPVVEGTDKTTVSYRTHVQSYGWQNWKHNGQTSGTEGQSKRLEAINIRISSPDDNYGGIRYTTHVQGYGWQGLVDNENTWRHDGQMSGTSGESKRLEAIRINLYGGYMDDYDVYYRVHAQSFGWLGWAKNGEPAGTAGMSKRLEGIQIVLVEKGGPAPAADYGQVVSVKQEAFISQ